MKSLILVGSICLLAVAGLAYFALRPGSEAGPKYRTTAVTRGDLIATISATGTVEPDDVVDVGARVVGQIEKLGTDPQDASKTIDYGSEVQEGSILAVIDDSVYRAEVSQQEASLLRAKADLLQLQARQEQAKLDLDRAESLRPQRAIAGSDYDVIVANYKAASANVAVGEATIKQTEASLSLATTNLNYTVIKSPVKGVIIDRRVNVGQTVVSSLNAPSLFLIAKDLRKMEVWASVNEADIGRVKQGMHVRFSVDAYPGVIFEGEVAQVRLNATMTQNVVTYTVVVATDNSDGRLLPYLTANLRFETDERHGVLLVPNTALRWKPKPERIVPALRESLAATEKGARGRPDAGAVPKEAPAKTDGKDEQKPPRERDDHGQLWVADGDFVRPVDVRVGLTDGTLTEVQGDALKEGMEIVFGEVQAREADTTKNPFAPPSFRTGGGGQQKSQP